MRPSLWRVLLPLVSILIACGGSARPGPLKGGGGASGDAGGEVGGTAGVGGEGAPTTGGSAEGGAAPDPLPPRPPWNPPLLLGEAGWQGSSEPFCPPQQGHLRAFSVWADAAAVHALFGTDCNPLAGNGCSGSEGASLWKNSGAGWQTDVEFGDGVSALAGIPGGATLVGAVVDGQAGIYAVENGKLRLSRALDGLSGLQLFAAGADHVYARHDSEVLEYRAGAWTSLGTLPTPVLTISGGEDFVVAAGLDQTVYLKQGSAAFEPLPDVPAGSYTASWAFGASDIWVGNGVGQLVHYDGETWRVVETGSRDATGSGVVAMWGDRGTVYFMTFTELGRATQAGAELLFERSASAEPTDPYFSPQSLWGKSKDEVFLTISDAAFAKYACGQAFVVWFDGTEFHQF